MATALENRETPIEIVGPIDVDRLAEAFRTFQEFKQRLLTKDDSVMIAGRQYLKKSAWRKWALACSVSDELVSYDRMPAQGKDADGNYSYRVVVRAFHEKSSRSAVGVAVASKNEKKDWAHEEHDVFTLAHTRAKNRAIADLVGGGEVSAEEMTSDDGGARTRIQEDAPARSAARPEPPSASDLTNEALGKLMWAESLKLPQLSTVRVTPALLRDATAKLLYDRLRSSADASWKVGEVTYKLSATQDGTEFLQKWASRSGGVA